MSRRKKRKRKPKAPCAEHYWHSFAGRNDDLLLRECIRCGALAVYDPLAGGHDKGD